jgi:DNA primase
LRISETKIAEVAAAADIVQVISEYVGLRKAGKDYRGVCPFHGDKDPSFYVVPHKGIFHCFGCNTGGSVFNFLMKAENLSFVEAVRLLAQRYGIPLPLEDGDRSRAREREHDRLLGVLEEAQRYFRENLETHSGAVDYLLNRGIGLEWFDRVGFGFAPDSWEGVQAHLKRAGIDVRDAVAVGLVKPRTSGGYYDHFRSRLTIPIRDLNGRLVAFGGRIYGEGDPKYLNSPEGPLFKKGNLLYGLDTAKTAVRKEGCLVLVEGYFDQISLRVRGLEHVVAPLGTAIGPEQVRLVRRFTGEVVTVFDGDEAGQRAARRAIPLFLAEGIEPRCVVLRDDKDPDEAINRLGADGFRAVLANAVSMVDFLLEGLSARHDLTTLHGRNLAVEEALPLLRDIADSKERDYLLERFSWTLKVREDRLRRLVQSRPASGLPRKDTGPGKGKTLFDFPAAERNVVRGMLLRDGFIERAAESGVVKDLEDPVLKALAERMLAFRSQTRRFDPIAFSSALESPDMASIVATWLSPRAEEDDLRPEVDGDRAIDDSLDMIRRGKLEKRKAEIQERMRRCDAGNEEYNELARELLQLGRQLRR